VSAASADGRFRQEEDWLGPDGNLVDVFDGKQEWVLMMGRKEYYVRGAAAGHRKGLLVDLVKSLCTTATSYARDPRWLREEKVLSNGRDIPCDVVQVNPERTWWVTIVNRLVLRDKEVQGGEWFEEDYSTINLGQEPPEALWASPVRPGDEEIDAQIGWRKWR
jgi:hypothetical protein